MRRFILIDRDGTLNVEKDYLSDPDDLELTAGAGDALARLQKAGYGLAVLTNQSGIARGYFDHARLDAIHARLHQILAAYGVTLDGIYICPHGPDADCPCRKPRPGMVHQAAAALGFDPHQAVMIGDKKADLELGRAVGAATILVRTGYGRKTEAQCPAELADAIVDDLAAAADWVLSQRPQT